MSKLLIDEYPLLVLPSLAVKIGLNEAIVLQQVHYWIKQSGKPRDGKMWIYNTFDDWQRQFPFFSMSTLKRTIKSLEESNLLITGNYNKQKTDRTKWYTIDINLLNSPLVQNDTMGNSALVQNDTISLAHFDTMDNGKMTHSIPENNTEITTKTTTSNVVVPLHNNTDGDKLPKGITQKLIDKLTVVHGSEVVQQQLANLQTEQSKGNIKNPAGWLRTAVVEVFINVAEAKVDLFAVQENKELEQTLLAKLEFEPVPPTPVIDVKQSLKSFMDKLATN